MAFSTKQILTNNLNIGFNVMTCLSFKDRYNLCLTSNSLFETLFKKYQHNEIIKIKFKDYGLCDIWDNIKFRIDIRYSNIRDVSMLGKVHTLKLYNCPNITDVSMLGKIHILYLYCCHNIRDISMLGNNQHQKCCNETKWRYQHQKCCNETKWRYQHQKCCNETKWRCHTLYLFGCRNITDVSMLGNLHTLNLSWCVNVTDVSMLGNIHTLNLGYCFNIKDVSMLGKVHTLNLSNCSDIPKYQIDELKKTVKNLKY